MRTKRIPALAVALAVGATSTITPAIVLPTAATAAEGGGSRDHLPQNRC